MQWGWWCPLSSTPNILAMFLVMSTSMVAGAPSSLLSDQDLCVCTESIEITTGSRLNSISAANYQVQSGISHICEVLSNSFIVQCIAGIRLHFEIQQTLEFSSKKHVRKLRLQQH